MDLASWSVAETAPGGGGVLTAALASVIGGSFRRANSRATGSERAPSMTL